jgi:LysM repeat protein
MAQKPETHTVTKGDTLWDLARTYLGDPFLWPQLYRLNTNVVEDPHWIYPGQVLRLTAGGQEVAAVPSAETPPPAAAKAAPGEQAPAAAPAAAAPGLAEPQVGELREQEKGDSEDLSVLVGKSRQPRFGPVLETNLQRNFRPVRRTEFYSSGFLTEGARLPLGQFLGDVTPTQIEEASTRSSSFTYSRVAVTPPPGGRYEVGDSLLVVEVQREIPGYGNVIVPTGVLRVIDVSRPENLAEVVATYSPLHNGQFVMLAEKFVEPGNVRPVPISDGLHGAVIDSRDPQPLKGPMDVLFINRGRQDGVGIGDMFEIRQTPRERPNAATTISEVMATIQIVHLGEHTATGRMVRVVQPKIEQGMEVRQVAKLPS